jgi:hypothetical protein
MRRGLALARDYARRREAFGAPLSKQPLHVDTVAGLQAEFEAALQLSFCMAELIGADECGELDEQSAQLLRVLTSLAKLTTARQAVAVASEVLEAFGGAGYIEDTGLPMLLRDSQVLPIWEGTTNVLALDGLRALGRPEAWRAIEALVERHVAATRDARLSAAGQSAVATVAHARRWHAAATLAGRAALEAGARRCALSLGRAIALALLVGQAQWSLEAERDGRARAVALRFAASGVDQIFDGEPLLEETNHEYS